MDLFADGDEVRGKFFGGFRRETGSAAAGFVSFMALRRG